MRIAIHSEVQTIAKARGAMLLRSLTPLDGYRPTGTAKDRYDRLLTPEAAQAFAAILSAPEALSAALADGYVDLPIASNGVGKPAAQGPTLGSLLSAPEASAKGRTRTAK